jgi:hypothetical protein
MFNGLNLADTHRKVVRVGKDTAEEFCSFGQIGGKFGEKIEKFGVSGDEAHLYKDSGTLSLVKYRMRQEQSNISRAAWGRQPFEMLASWTAGRQNRGSAGCAEVNDAEQSKNGRRSESHRLQESDEETYEIHWGIMGVLSAGSEVTDGVEPRCQGNKEARQTRD